VSGGRERERERDLYIYIYLSVCNLKSIYPWNEKIYISMEWKKKVFAKKVLFQGLKNVYIFC
jgi:hypothetical protein